MRMLISLAAAGLLVAACGGDDDSAGGGSPTDVVASDAAVTEDAGSQADSPPAEEDTAQAPDTTADGNTGAPIELSGPCSLEKRYGAFLVEAQDGFSFVDGSVANGVVPVTILELVEEEGPCRLLKRNNPFCNPPCGPGQTCDHDGSCITFPEPQDLGTVEITGLADEALLEPLQPGNSYFLTTLPHPGFEGGAAIHLTSSEGAFGVLDLHGVGVDLLETEKPLWEVEEAKDLAISWPAPVTPGVPSVARLDLNIDQHGNSPVVLQCDFPDTGSAAVPAALIDQLLTSGVSGYPNGRVTRRTVDSAPVSDGCMEFIVASPLEADIEVVGHTPCKSDSDCPDGETCTLAIETCG